MKRDNNKKLTLTIKLIFALVILSTFLSFFAQLPETGSYFTSENRVPRDPSESYTVNFN